MLYMLDYDSTGFPPIKDVVPVLTPYLTPILRSFTVHVQLSRCVF